MVKTPEKSELSLNPEKYKVSEKSKENKSVLNVKEMDRKVKEANEARKDEANKDEKINSLKNELDNNFKNIEESEDGYLKKTGRAALKVGKAGSWPIRASLAVATDTALSSVRAGWKFIKKMGWGILTGRPPSAGEMWKDILAEFKEDNNKNK